MLVCFLFGCKPDNHKLILVFTGDVMLDRGVRIQINKNGIDKLFANVKDEFHSANYSVINLECPVTADSNPEQKKYLFRGEPQYLASLRKVGITHASLANNHTIDQGSMGLKNTAENLMKNDITPIGWGPTPASSCEPVMIDSNGIRIALFAIDFITLEGWKQKDSLACPCMFNGERVIHKIVQLKKENPSLIIVVIVHWGVEYQTNPDGMQIKIAHAFVDSGADLIIGAHPHVVQDMENYKDKYIFYSLGNFIFDQNRPGTNHGEMVRIELTPGKIQSVLGRKVNIYNCVPSVIETKEN